MAMHGGGCDVQGVGGSPGRQTCVTEQNRWELSCRLRDLQECQLRDGLEPCGGCTRIALASFLDHDRRRIQVELVSSSVPPFACHLLVPRHSDVFRRTPSGQIADDAVLHIHGRLHTLTVS